MKLIDRTRMGEYMPRFHRLAYDDWTQRRGVTALIGLHLLIRWCHRIWEWSFDYRPSDFEAKIADAFNAGSASRTQEVVRLLDERDAAYEQGRIIGRTEGYIWRSREYEDSNPDTPRPWKQKPVPPEVAEILKDQKQ